MSRGYWRCWRPNRQASVVNCESKPHQDRQRFVYLLDTPSVLASSFLSNTWCKHDVSQYQCTRNVIQHSFWSEYVLIGAGCIIPQHLSLRQGEGAVAKQQQGKSTQQAASTIANRQPLASVILADDN